MGIAPETWPGPLRTLIRMSNKHLLNPLMLRLAGRPSWYASAIHHTGRRSHRSYTTPIVADRVGDQLYVPLPYGTDVDWLRNVMTAGEADVDRRGETHHVVSPQIIDSDTALPLLPADRRRTFERIRIAHFLRAEIATPT